MTKIGSIFLAGQHWQAPAQKATSGGNRVPSLTAGDGETNFVQVSPSLLEEQGRPVRVFGPDITFARTVGGDPVTLPEGLTVLFGGPGTGKSFMTRLLDRAYRAASSEPLMISFGEPESSVFGGLGDLVRLIDDGLANNPEPALIIIDSVKSFVFRASGAAGSRGSNPTLGEDLAILGNQARASGVRLVIVVNPSSDERDDVYRAVLTSLRGGAQAVIETLPGRKATISTRDRREATELVIKGLPDTEEGGTPVVRNFTRDLSAMRGAIVSDLGTAESVVISPDEAVIEPTPRDVRIEATRAQFDKL